jgi:6-phosphogluconolactonase
MKKTQHGNVVRKLTMFGATLSLLLGLPFAFANRVFADPTPKFAYVANRCISAKHCSGNVSAYTINSFTGALRAVAGSPFADGNQPLSVTVDPSDRFAYVANFFVGSVSAYAINGSTGALRAVAGSPFAAGNGASSVTVDPSGRFAYVANYQDFTVSAYTINGSTGALRAVAGSPFTTGSQPDSVTVDPSSRFVYVATTGGDVFAYTINNSTGALRAVAGSPFAAGGYPQSVAVDPSGQFVFVANECVALGDCSTGNVSAYTINSSTGALRAVAGSPFGAGNGPLSVTLDPSGRFAYVANFGDNTVAVYTINSSTGALRAVGGSPFPAGNSPLSVAVDSSDRFAYVANYCLSSSDCSVGTVSAYTINSSTGALSAVAGSPFAAGAEPQSVAIANQAQTTSVLMLTPRSLAFGNVAVDSSSRTQVVTVTNTSPNAVAITGIALRGTAPRQFAFTKDCGQSLAGHATCTLEVQFTPSVKGAKTAFLDVNGGSGGRSVMLSGTGT